jgi:hypothetical protein
MNGRNGLDKLTITNYLKNSAMFVEVRDGVRFDGAPTTAYIFKYKELGISLKKNLTADEKLQMERDKLNDAQEEFKASLMEDKLKEKTVDEMMLDFNKE